MFVDVHICVHLEIVLLIIPAILISLCTAVPL